MTSNARAALLMTLSMAAFACEDTLLKLMSAHVSTGALLFYIGLGGMLAFGLWVAFGPEGLRLRHLGHPLVILRSCCEAICGVTFVTALSMGDLSIASAILQALPLLMTLGAALFLREPVGWRRWMSIAVGFVGVLMIVQPGTAAFQPSSVLAVIAVLALAVRDLSTRQIPKHIGSGMLTSAAFGAMALGGLVLILLRGDALVLPSPGQAGAMLVTLGFGLAGYITMVIATRVGEIGAIAPFRYTRLVFAITLGVVVFGERPDGLALLGAAIIAGAGGYAMWREARLRRRSFAPAG